MVPQQSAGGLAELFRDRAAAGAGGRGRQEPLCPQVHRQAREVNDRQSDAQGGERLHVPHSLGRHRRPSRPPLLLQRAQLRAELHLQVGSSFISKKISSFLGIYLSSYKNFKFL